MAVVAAALLLPSRAREDQEEGHGRLRHFRRFRRYAGLFCHALPSRMDVGCGKRTFHHLRFFRSLSQLHPFADHAGCALCPDYPCAAVLLQPQADQDLRGLAILSSVLASEAYGYAYVSVWCFFAAMLSLYLVYMIRHLATAGLGWQTVSTRREG